MAATNERVDQINQNKGGLEIGQLYYLRADRVQDRPQTYIQPTEFLNSLTPSGLPSPHFALEKIFPYNTHTEL